MTYKTPSKSALFICLCLATAFNNVFASDLDNAVTAMRAGDFAEAYCIMRPLAENGDADAQYNIGWMYMNGYGLRVNDSLALEWWQKAAAQGHSDASFSIGMLYSLGDGEVAKDSDAAIDNYLVAAIDGHEDAIVILKSMMLRNDEAITERLYSIIKDHESLFGIKRQVKATKLNARKGPSTESKIITRLLKGEVVLELNKQEQWSQVVALRDEAIKQTIWVYSPLLEDILSAEAIAE
ncbi:MAG: SEL1-like repeat protein [Gammaproteobacteria bacterium]|nr:SEL1-like repeat protein [Gammaproteobacteria bacterium]MBT8134034.1 SEL1-like repeat protein [Gammaproteobacteria bacterium]NNJ50660.1 SH3 domain-containing protein [Gammaproteobacteria bacterium]